MTEDKTLQVLMCINPGEPVRADTIMARTGLSRLAAGQRLSRLCNAGKLVRLCCGVYALAGNVPAPERFAQEVRAAESAKRQARLKASKDRYAAKQRAERRAAKAMQRSIRAIPNSVFQLGALA